MIKPLLFSALLFTISACKKSEPTDSKSDQKVFSYFKDTSSNKATGLEPSGGIYLESIPFVEDIDTFLLPFFASFSLPTEWTIEVPPAGKQIYNSCVGWAIGHGMLGYQYKIIGGYTDYKNLDRIFSASYIWNQLNNGQDKGISLVEGLNLIKKQGCCKWSFMPANTYSINLQPSNEARANAANFRLSEYMKFKTVDIDLLKYLLSKNYPIPFGAIVDTGFMNGKDPKSFKLISDGRLVWQQPSGAKIGGHAMLLCGYDDNIHAFKVLNSWGHDWGNQGYIWIDYDYFKTVVMKNLLQRPEIYLGVTRKFGTVADIDGNIYKTIFIGKQEWMVENLKVTRFRNGDIITIITDSFQWQNATSPAYCVYNNDNSLLEEYGFLYNGFVVRDSRNIAPIGWHVPSNSDWEQLENYLGGNAIAAGKMKEVGTTHWNPTNYGADNLSGFTALPGGGRGPYFNGLGNTAAWWSATEYSSNINFFRNIVSNSITVTPGQNLLYGGLSIRCVKD